jgi:hypothetical protein
MITMIGFPIAFLPDEGKAFRNPLLSDSFYLLRTDLKQLSRFKMAALDFDVAVWKKLELCSVAASLVGAFLPRTMRSVGA